MIARPPRTRSGITLTEILISILIMGLGMISLAVLFPIGLLRLHSAQRLSRGVYLAESAIHDLSTRNLLWLESFTDSAISPWYGGVNPWTQDTISFNGGASGGAFRSVGPGLPVAYDPLWRYQTNFANGGYYLNAPLEARFASGIGFVDTTHSGDAGAPSAYGLQRLTNFYALNYYNTTNPPASTSLTANPVPEIFVSPEDVIFEEDSSVALNSPNTSPVVPDLSIGGLPTNDWHYTWFLTGQQSDANNSTVFNADVVICENREFNIETVTGPVGGTAVTQVAGETVVEGIFGYSPNVIMSSASTNPAGFAIAATNTVVLRWPATMDDPDVRVGGWIADVTYERSAATDQARMTYTLGAYPQVSGAIPAVTIPPMQRCYWYQIAKKSPPDVDVLGNASYRSMTVWTMTPLRVQTLLSAGGAPVFANAALIMPSVVNVYSHTFYTH